MSDMTHAWYDILAQTLTFRVQGRDVTLPYASLPFPLLEVQDERGHSHKMARVDDVLACLCARASARLDAQTCPTDNRKGWA